MNTLKTLLIILNGQKLAPGFLSPAGSGTALETVISLMNQFSPYVLIQNPLFNHTTLLTPAWVASLDGQDAIFLAGVNGQLNLANNPQPAYKFAS